MFGLTGVAYDVVDDVIGADVDRPTSIGCYAASSSSSEISQSNSVDLDPAWTAAVKKYPQARNTKGGSITVPVDNVPFLFFETSKLWT